MHIDSTFIKSIVSCLITAALAMAAAGAGAAATVSLVGDKDGLGLGLASGDSFDIASIGPADGDGTDELKDDNFSFVHDYILAGTVTSAQLEIFTGGFGLGAPAGVFLNGTFVGNLTDGDQDAPPYNHAYKDIFDLTPQA